MIYKNKNTGFTLVELIVVISLAAILLVTVTSSGLKQKTIARDKVRVADIQTIRLALEEYKLACGEYPARLETTADNGNCPSGVNLGNYLPHIPEVPVYSGINNYPDQDGQYFYYGLSSVNNGKCFDYIVGVQLEYGADDDFSGNVNSDLLNQVDKISLAPGFSHRYSRPCLGSEGNGIVDADDHTYGVYGFRSTTNVY